MSQQVAWASEFYMVDAFLPITMTSLTNVIFTLKAIGSKYYHVY